jgi:CRP-like cAMP-binding protein
MTPVEVTFKPGDMIFTEKQDPSAIYIIREGQVEIVRFGKNNAKVPIAIIGPGEYLGELAIIQQRQHSSTAIAVGKVVAVKIDRAAFESQLKTIPPFLITLMKSLAERLSTTSEIVRRNTIVDSKVSDAFKAAEQRAETEKKSTKK